MTKSSTVAWLRGKHSLLNTLAFLLLGLGTTSAQAYSCDKGEARKSYDTGFSQGQVALRGAWARLGKKCSRQGELRSLLSRLHDAATPKGEPSVFIQCRIDGHKVGMHSVLKEIRLECSKGAKG